MLMRAVLGASLAVALAASAPSWSASGVVHAAPPQAPPQPAAPGGPSDLDDDVTIRAFLHRLEETVQSGEPTRFAALEGPLGNESDALAFANAEMRPGATRVVIQERDRQELTLSGIPGAGYALTVDAFIEYGNQARVATWQFFVRRSGDSWGIVRQQIVSTVDNLFRLNLDTSTQFDVHALTIRAEDMALTLDEGSAFGINTDNGITGLVRWGAARCGSPPRPRPNRARSASSPATRCSRPRSRPRTCA